LGGRWNCFQSSHIHIMEHSYSICSLWRLRTVLFVLTQRWYPKSSAIQRMAKTKNLGKFSFIKITRKLCFQANPTSRLMPDLRRLHLSGSPEKIFEFRQLFYSASKSSWSNKNQLVNFKGTAVRRSEGTWPLQLMDIDWTRTAHAYPTNQACTMVSYTREKSGWDRNQLPESALGSMFNFWLLCAWYPPSRHPRLDQPYRYSAYS
jgi:hypothetical protein